MGRYDIEEVEVDENDQIFDNDYGRFAERKADQPRRSPIRRKYKLRQEEGMKSKAKRNQHRLKYDWQGE